MQRFPTPLALAGIAESPHKTWIIVAHLFTELTPFCGGDLVTVPATTCDPRRSVSTPCHRGAPSCSGGPALRPWRRSEHCGAAGVGRGRGRAVSRRQSRPIVGGRIGAGIGEDLATQLGGASYRLLVTVTVALWRTPFRRRNAAMAVHPKFATDGLPLLRRIPIAIAAEGPSPAG